jgi:hypothetical protein
MSHSRVKRTAAGAAGRFGADRQASSPQDFVAYSQLWSERKKFCLASGANARTSEQLLSCNSPLHNEESLLIQCATQTLLWIGVDGVARLPPPEPTSPTTGESLATAAYNSDGPGKVVIKAFISGYFFSKS